ncbi:MAG: hypothetical protein HY668_00075 [Chloroflexi bacterium]|nr:hypothetical protein [Chloroflexota bacterium]
MTTGGSLSNKQKLDIVLKRNTFFFRSEDFEDKWEARISSITNLLLFLQSELRTKKSLGDKKKVVVDLLLDKPDGLTALLALTSISEEFLLRLITFARTIQDKELSKLVRIESFSRFPLDKEVSKSSLFRLVRTDRHATESIVNLLFEGYSVHILQEYLPLFELKKLNFSKLEFTTESLVDTIVRQAKRGSYKAQDKNDPAGLIKLLLDTHKIPYVTKITLAGISRTMDFVIPNKSSPKILVECSFEVTTSSAMGDKAKTEIQVISDIKRHYSNTAFVGFVDGIGWYVRKKDLARLVGAFDNVFTFKNTELARFLEFVKSVT